MDASVITLNVKLEAATKQDGDFWVAWCLPLDVYSQAETKEKSLEALQEVVELWFESCISRNVLDQALLESGFIRARPDEDIPVEANLVHLTTEESLAATYQQPEYIEVSVPAYIAASLTGTCAPG